jgi:peptidoglycan/LPS O-acetylase OafA/YrhL
VNRFWIIDVMKGLGAQFILLHHLSIYGPIAEEIALDYPIALDNFTEFTRLAVQAFLVISGFLTAKALTEMRQIDFFGLVVKRYTRLAPFFIFSLTLSVIALITLENYLWGSWVPELPTWIGFLAHVFLLQGVMNVPSISSGVWYVAIDFQLFALTMLVASWMSFGDKTRIDNVKLKLSLALLCLSSLWIFNLYESMDNWAVYFFGAYALGIFARWAQESKANRNLFFGLFVLGCMALIFEPRIRILTALIVSMVLFLWAQNKGEFLSPKLKTAISIFGDSAYAVFLNHFVLILIFSAVWNFFEFQGLHAAICMSLLFWGMAFVWGIYLHLTIEMHLHRLQLAIRSNLKGLFVIKQATELYKAI